MSSQTIMQRISGALLLAALTALPAAAPAGDVEVKRTRTQFSMEFRDADIRDVLRAVGQAAGLNLVIGDNVTGLVSLSLKDVDLLDAFEAILRTKGFTYVRDGNIVRVLSAAEATEGDMEARVFPLGHASGKDMLAVVEQVKSDRAKISVDNRMNAIVVKDLSLNVDRMERLLQHLDTRMPQILIEAKIVEVASNYTRELGVQWGGQYKISSSQGTGVISGGSTAVTTSTSSGGGTSTSTPPIGSSTFYPLTGDIGRSGNAYAVNLPAAVGPGSGGALGFTFGKFGGKFSLDFQISALVSTGNGKVLSSPKVLTINNKEAKISSGTDIPIKTQSSTAAGATAGVQIISATLSLSTIPTIMSDNRISMIVRVDKAEPDYSQKVDGIPTIVRREAKAELTVSNGETVVLGGIYTKTEAKVVNGIPLLSQIPLIGWLFKKEQVVEKQAELMIFITPTIVRD